MTLEALADAVTNGRKLALVTGANRGIGNATAAALLERGVAVLVGARNPDRGRTAVAELSAISSNVALIHIDLDDLTSITAAAADMDAAFKRLDILINNAAIKLEFHPCPPSQVALETVRATYETNVFGTMAMMQAMVPLLLRSEAGRIVNVSSSLGSIGRSSVNGTRYHNCPLLGYSTTKAALNSLTMQFANELQDTPLKINAVDPGYTRTEMTQNDGTRTPEEAAQVIIDLALLDAGGPSGGYFDENGPIPW